MKKFTRSSLFAAASDTLLFGGASSAVVGLSILEKSIFGDFSTIFFAD